MAKHVKIEIKKCTRCYQKDDSVSERLNPYMQICFQREIFEIMCDKCEKELIDEI